MSAPYWMWNNFDVAWSGTGVGGGFIINNVNNVCTLTTSSGKGRILWSSGATANTHSARAVARGAFLGSGATIADGEVLVDIETPNGAGVGGCVFGRAAVSGDFECYMVREVTPGTPTGGWALYYYADNNPEKLAEIGRITPTGVTGYPVRIRYGFVGPFHFVKIWNAGSAEPSWYTATNVLLAQHATKVTAGALGAGGWGINATGKYAAFDNIAVAAWNELRVAETDYTFATMVDNGDRTSYGGATVTFPLYAKAGMVLWVTVANTKGSAADAPTSISCTGLTFGSPLVASLQYDSSTAKRLTVYPALCTADCAGNLITVSFGATETGCIVHAIPLGGAKNTGTDGSAAFLHAASGSLGSAGTTITLTLAAFSNPYLTSGTIYSVAHSANEGTTPATGFNEPSGADNSHSSPNNGLETGWLNGNDTSIDPQWVANQRAGIIGAEVVLANPYDEYPSMLAKTMVL